MPTIFAARASVIQTGYRPDRCSRIGRRGPSTSQSGYSDLMPANLITLRHFSISSLISVPKVGRRACERCGAEIGEVNPPATFDARYW